MRCACAACSIDVMACLSLWMLIGFFYSNMDLLPLYHIQYYCLIRCNFFQVLNMKQPIQLLTVFFRAIEHCDTSFPLEPNTKQNVSTTQHEVIKYTRTHADTRRAQFQFSRVFLRISDIFPNYAKPKASQFSPLLFKNKNQKLRHI